MKTKQVMDSLGALEDVYVLGLATVLTSFQDQILNPWLEKKGWRFSAGMGTYNFNDAKGNYIWEDDRRIPQYISDVLASETMYNTSFGAMLEDYPKR